MIALFSELCSYVTIGEATINKSKILKRKYVYVLFWYTGHLFANNQSTEYVKCFLHYWPQKTHAHFSIFIHVGPRKADEL